MCLDDLLHGRAQGQLCKSDNSGSHTYIAGTALTRSSDPFHKLGLANRAHLIRTVRSVHLHILYEHRGGHTVAPSNILQ